MREKTKKALGVSTAPGKGDGCRIANFKKFYENYDEINWKSKKKQTKKALIEYINNKGKVNKNER